MQNSISIVSMTLLAVLAGCGESEVSGPELSTTGASGSEYLTASEPTGAVAVGKARETTQDGDSVLLVGTIGGSTQPFVEGAAAFTIVDPSVPYCAAEEGCPTPWDYCCTQDQVKDNIATVKIVDTSGNTVAEDARPLLGVRELSTVVVQGEAQRDEHGNLTVAATQVYVRPGK